MLKDELEKSYLATTYSVLIDGEQYDIKIGELVPSVINKLLDNGHTAVIITAWNPRSQAYSLEENKQRNINLLASFDNKHLVHHALGQGNDPSWQAEESFFILDINQEVTEQLAIDYEQYAYVWLEANKPASLVFTGIWNE
jgi:hypothetical protein